MTAPPTTAPAENDPELEFDAIESFVAALLDMDESDIEKQLTALARQLGLPALVEVAIELVNVVRSGIPAVVEVAARDALAAQNTGAAA